MLENENVRMIVQETVGTNPSKAVIPTGFYYVTGTPSKGVVISDKVGDDDLNSKGGNQFVWITCNGDSGVAYEKENGLASTWKSKYSDKQYKYTEYSGWTDLGGNPDSVAKYGGFYIARYEAGIPSDAEFYANTDGATYVLNRDTDEYTPVSKKNNPSWSRISQNKAKAISEKMYNENMSVASSLVDSYAWDTVVEFMEKDTEYSGIGSNSIKYGNYENNSGKTLNNALYVIHRIIVRKSDLKWADATSSKKYGKGQVTTIFKTLTEEEQGKYDFYNNDYTYDRETYDYNIVTELATGALEDAKVKNIYDMAGNMWEWTTENGKRGSTLDEAPEYAVIRGGSFDQRGDFATLASRAGFDALGWYNLEVGFRVVLYIK